MIITNEAKNLLQAVLVENDADGIRLSLTEGCCGSQFALSLDKPKETDTLITVNEIKVAVDAQIQGTDHLTLDKEKDSEQLVLLGASSCC